LPTTKPRFCRSFESLSFRRSTTSHRRGPSTRAGRFVAVPWRRICQYPWRRGLPPPVRLAYAQARDGGFARPSWAVPGRAFPARCPAGSDAVSVRTAPVRRGDPPDPGDHFFLFRSGHDATISQRPGVGCAPIGNCRSSLLQRWNRGEAMSSRWRSAAYECEALRSDRRVNHGGCRVSFELR